MYSTQSMQISYLVGVEGTDGVGVDIGVGLETGLGPGSKLGL